jgi:transglutaminase superfamily protein
VVILAAWAVALAWLIDRVSFRSTGARLAESALSVSPGAVFYRLSIGAQQLGYASTTVDTLVDSLRLVDVFVFDVPALGRLNRTEGRSVAILDRSLHLRDLASEVDGEMLRFATHAAVGSDRLLHVTITSGDDSLAGTLPAGDTVEVPSLWPLRMAFGGGLRVGRTGHARVFDPFTAALRSIALRIGAESTFVVADSADYDSTTMAWVPVRFDTVRAFRVDMVVEGRGPAATWIDAQGRTVRTTTSLGFTMERTAFEVAYENFRHRDTLRLMRSTALPDPNDVVPATLLAAGVRPDSAGSAVFRVRLGGGVPDGLALAGPRQQLAADTLVVTREDAATLRARYRLPNTDPALRPLRDPDLLINSGDLRVAAQARLLAGRDRDPTRVAARLVHWVAGAVRPERSSGPVDAAQVLERRRGDANECTVLFVALARALGLPARPVSGLVRAAGRYYYHAWAEVYLGDWVAVDPMLDQLPADAVHLRLVIGDFVRPADLARLVGRLTLDSP